MPDFKEMLASNRNWKDDFDHENGRYVNECMFCHKPFMGYKRRVVCFECNDKTKDEIINEQIKKT
jgi:hypothetical protein